MVRTKGGERETSDKICFFSWLTKCTFLRNYYALYNAWMKSFTRQYSDDYICAANFSFAQLAKRKSLGRSKPATNSQAQALQHTVWNVFTITKPYWTAFYRNKLSTSRCEWVRLFISRLVQSAYSSVRSRCWEITTILYSLGWCQIL